MSLKLGKFGAFIGCSNYPECKFTRVLSPTGAESGEGERPGVRVLGQDPETGDEITLRNGRFGEYVQQGEGEKPKRSSLPKGLKPDDVTLEKALALLSLPREVARHPTSGEPIVAGIGRYGSYVQHGKTYANLGRDDDVLEIGANRAIDLIVAKESGAGGSRFGGGGAGRALGDHPAGRRGQREAGPLRRLCQSRQDQRDAAEGNGPGEPDARGRGGAAQGQGGGRRRRVGAAGRRASGRRPGHRARRPLRPLCQLGQGQRDHPEVDRAGFDYARRRAGADRRARGQARGDAAQGGRAKSASTKADAKPAAKARPAKATAAKAAPAKAKAAAKPPASKAAPKAATKKR